jgi:hypothetical protein
MQTSKHEAAERRYMSKLSRAVSDAKALLPSRFHLILRRPLRLRSCLESNSFPTQRELYASA